MKRKRWIQSGVLTAGALFLGGLPSEAMACQIRWAQFAPVEYDARERAATPVSLELDFGGVEDPTCAEAVISITPQTGAASLSGAGGALRIEPAEGRRHGLGLEVGLRSTQAMQGDNRRNVAVFEIAPHQFLAAGDYEQTFDLLLNGEAALAIEMKARILGVARFLRSETPMEIEFGDLKREVGSPVAMRAPPMKSIDFFYQATASATMEVSSTGGGHLRHEQEPELTPMPYILRINGRQMDMGTSQEIPLLPGGSRHGQISVTLTDVAGRHAGRYTDQVTVRITGQ